MQDRREGNMKIGKSLSKSLSSATLYSVRGSRAFLVGLDSKNGSKRITVHAGRNNTTRSYARIVGRRLEAGGHSKNCRVKRYRQSSLSRARTLADFVSRFQHDQIVFDPTGIFGRANALVSFAGEVRKKLGQSVDLVLWQQRYRTVYVVLDKKNYLEDRNLTRNGLADVEEIVRRALLDACGANATDYVKKIRIGFGAPADPIIAIDRQSYVRHSKLLRKIRSNTTATAMMAFLGLGVVATTASAEDHLQEPAVSSTNFELGLLGGSRDGIGTFFAEGAVTLPLGNSFGARIDGTAGTSDGDFLGGTALHLFKRDPAVGLLGIAGGIASVNPKGGINGPEKFSRFGGIGELYFDKLTITGFAGTQFSGGSEVESGFVGQLDLEWYPTDNLMYWSGVETNPESKTMGRIGVEYMPGMSAIPGLSLFAESAFGDDDFNRVYAGIRLYFGESKTLKDRHRRDTFRAQIMPTRMTDTARDNTTAPLQGSG